MQQSFDLFFVSSNKNKYLEAKEILQSFGIKLGHIESKLEELQDDSIVNIALAKSNHAYSKWKKPIIIEDDGLFISSLRGFPGPYSSYVFKTIGNDGILKLLGAKRNAVFQSVIVYHDHNELKVFSSKVHGRISKKISSKGWGYDPIFIPKNYQKTFSQLNKNKISHRYKALKKFSRWFIDKKISTCR